MNTTIRGFSFSLLAFTAAIGASGTSWAQDAGTSPDSTSAPADSSFPLHWGSYVAPLASYVRAVGRKSTGPNQLDHGDGGMLMFGYRKDFYALEVGPLYTDFSSGQSELGVQINGLVFPFKSRWLRGAFGTMGVSYEEVRTGPLNGATDSPYTGSNSYGKFSWDAGIGDLVPLHLWNYKFALRAQATYRYSQREKLLDANQVDYPAPRNFNEAVISIGLQLPFSLKHDSASAPPPGPVEVTPVDSGSSPAGAPPSAPSTAAAPDGAANPAAGGPQSTDQPAPAPAGGAGQGAAPATNGSSSDLDSILGSPPPPAPTPNKQ